MDKHPSTCRISANRSPASRQHLRAPSRRQLVVPRYRLSTYGRRAFAAAGPSVWNSLPDNLTDPAVGSDSFTRSLKTFLFATYWDMQRIRGSMRMHYTNLLLLTYLLTPGQPQHFKYQKNGYDDDDDDVGEAKKTISQTTQNRTMLAVVKCYTTTFWLAYLINVKNYQIKTHCKDDSHTSWLAYIFYHFARTHDNTKVNGLTSASEMLFRFIELHYFGWNNSSHPSWIA